ncbi:polysaccharide deacetylase family protein [uncultured Gemella sp.]|uniref:polysaccharide deacetylase family protein n=1 Tax=uncultured Gemella sp. TaxID=254352 RepID=UPI0028E24ACE|nr:polysaccharide deacetylase family protein [uncultured Gemella sp.]
MKKLGVFLGILFIAICTFLLFYGEPAYQKWQEYNFKSQVKDTVEAADKSDFAKDSSSKTGWLGDKFVKVYYPNSNSSTADEIKSRLDEETKGLVEGELNFNKDIKEIVFYGSKEKESNFANVSELSVEKVTHKISDKNVEAATESNLSSIFLTNDGKLFTLSSLFASPDDAKKKFLFKIQKQLEGRGVSEAEGKDAVVKLRDQDMADWKFTYGESKFNINIDPKVGEVSSVEVPMADLHKYITESYLKGEDLEKYKEYVKKRDRKAVALTFDDGPNPQTTPVALELLKKYKAKGTFFMVGRSVAGNEDLIKQVVAEGHQIGNHSWDHPVLTTISLEQAKKQINDTTEALKKASGQDVHIMRPPYGAINGAIQAAVDQSFILWDIDTLDWKNRNTASIMKEVRKTQPGSIILMHDIHQTSIDALPSILQYLTEQGFEMVTVDELMGDQLELHQSYTNRE